MESEMPQRFLRPGITTSERWNSVSFMAQSLYIRIITMVDDFGRCDGRPSVICGSCLSVWNELNPESCYNPQQVAATLQELAATKLVELYETEGKKVLQVTQWQERVREGCKEKWPQNPNPQEFAAKRSKLLPPSPSPTPPPVPHANAPEGPLCDIESFGKQLMEIYGRKSPARLTAYEESLAAALLRERTFVWDEFYSLRDFKSVTRLFPQSLTKLLEGWQEQLDRVANQPTKDNGLNGKPSLLEQENNRLAQIAKNL